MVLSKELNHEVLSMKFFFVTYKVLLCICPYILSPEHLIFGWVTFGIKTLSVTELNENGFSDFNVFKDIQ